jgi:hypothetical protein
VVEYFTFEGPQSFLLRPLIDWVRPTHIIEGNLLYSESTDLDINHLFKKLFQQHLHLYLTKSIYSLAKLYHKTNHHSHWPPKQDDCIPGHVLGNQKTWKEKKNTTSFYIYFYLKILSRSIVNA